MNSTHIKLDIHLRLYIGTCVLQLCSHSLTRWLPPSHPNPPNLTLECQTPNLNSKCLPDTSSLSSLFPFLSDSASLFLYFSRIWVARSFLSVAFGYCPSCSTKSGTRAWLASSCPTSGAVGLVIMSKLTFCQVYPEELETLLNLTSYTCFPYRSCLFLHLYECHLFLKKLILKDKL